MKRIPIAGKKPLGLIIAALCIGLALLGALFIDHQTSLHPSTDSGSIDADVVHVASIVGGRVINLPVAVNQNVHKGDLLYQLDPEPYEIAVRQAEAELALAQADVEEQERQVAVKTASARSADQQLTQARTQRDLAARTEARLRPLAYQHYIPWQQYDEARVALRNADATLLEAQQRQQATDIAIGDLKRSRAARQSRAAALDRARYNLRQTVVRASVDGYVTSLNIKEGEVLAPSQVLFTLVANDEWFANANIREINLKAVTPGTCATVYSMIDRKHPMRGHVESVGWGVQTDDTAMTARNVPYVAREMDWVHVAQRFPVRIRIDTPVPRLLRLGATANIEISYGAACH